MSYGTASFFGNAHRTNPSPASIAGMNAARLSTGLEPIVPPRESAVGSLVHYLAHADPKRFQPANTTFALMPALDSEVRRSVKRKADRHRIQVEEGLKAFTSWLGAEDTALVSVGGAI